MLKLPVPTSSSVSESHASGTSDFRDDSEDLTEQLEGRLEQCATLPHAVTPWAPIKPSLPHVPKACDAEAVGAIKPCLTVVAGSMPTKAGAIVLKCGEETGWEEIVLASVRKRQCAKKEIHNSEKRELEGELLELLAYLALRARTGLQPSQGPAECYSCELLCPASSY